ncbi:MAG: hypothetical protein ABIQ06_02225 [Caldimonas sp.]
MRTRHLLGLLLLAVSSASFAAPTPVEYVFVDDSSPMLIDTVGAVAVWKSQIDDRTRRRLQRLYPVSKWGFVSQVQGGFTQDGACVVTARTVLVPRVLGSRLVFKPQRSATAFGSQGGATREQCREFAALKLKEAIVGMRTSLIADR